MKRFFKWDFGCAAACIYAGVVVLANMDKEIVMILHLALRQAIVTFFVTSTVVAYVIAVARSKRGGLVRAYLLGTLVPATIVAAASFCAHWYFTNEYRNVFMPFVVSFVLNACAVTFARAGYITVLTQLKHVIQLMRRP